MTITLTDHERAFADTLEGRAYVARAERDHRIRETHKGQFARPWTDAMHAEAVRRGSVTAARSAVARQVNDAAPGNDLEVLRAAQATAAAMRKQRLRDGWRG